MCRLKPCLASWKMQGGKKRECVVAEVAAQDFKFWGNSVARLVVVVWGRLGTKPTQSDVTLSRLNPLSRTPKAWPALPQPAQPLVSNAAARRLGQAKL